MDEGVDIAEVYLAVGVHVVAQLARGVGRVIAGRVAERQDERIDVVEIDAGVSQLLAGR
ncbi:MAG: hypothetical protein AB1716_00385 [Planctomycetota bacterium]